MSNYSLLLDVAKARQVELLQDVEKTRITRELKRKQTARPILKRLQILLSAIA